jgi:beta-N-acetylhexosaminidase
VRRILDCKQKFALDERRTVDVDEVMAVVGSPEHREIEQEIARKSITVVKDTAGRIPLPVAKTLVIGPLEIARALSNEISSARMAHQLDSGSFSDMAMGRLADVKYAGVGPDFAEEQLSEARVKAAAAEAIVFLTKHKEPWTAVPQNEAAQAALVREMEATGKPVVVVALRNPYDIRRFTEIPTYLCTYGYTPASLAALAEVLVGSIPAQGQLPVDLPTEAVQTTEAAPEGDTTAWGF